MKELLNLMIREITMKVRIDEFFSDNKFKVFRQYCLTNDIVYLEELENFDFQSLLEYQGIGVGKVTQIIDRFSENYGYSIMHELISVESKMFDSELIESEVLMQDIEFLHYLLKLLGIKKSQFKKFLDDDVKMIRDLSEKEVVKTDKNYDAWKLVVETLEMSLSDLVNYICDIIRRDPTFSIFSRRIKGDTLSEIGRDQDVTRERIRQVSAKTEKKISEIGKLLMMRVFKNKSIVRLNDIDNILNNDQNSKNIMYSFKMRKTYNYINYIEAFSNEFTDKTHLEVFLDIQNNIIGEFQNYYDVMEEVEEVLLDNGVTYINSSDFIDFLKYNGYVVKGTYVRKGSNSYVLPLVEMIRRHYREGFFVHNEDCINELKNLTDKEYDVLTYPSNTRAISARLGDKLVLCGRGKYIHEDNIKIDYNLLRRIRTHINNTKSDCLLYHEIYEVFQDELSRVTSVSNRHYLHGVLMHVFPDDYDYRRDELTKLGKTRKNISERISDYVLDQGRIVTYEELKSQFKGITDAIINNALYSMDELILWEHKKYNHMDLISIDSKEIHNLQTMIQELLQMNNGYVSEKQIYWACEKNMNDFLSRERICNSMNLYYIISNLFEDLYSF